MKIQATGALALAALLVSGCATKPVSPTFSGGDGASLSSPVVISGVRSEAELRAAQRAWVAANLPGAEWAGGKFVIGPCACHAADVRLADGSRRTVYFDISRLGR